VSHYLIDVTCRNPYTFGVGAITTDGAAADKGDKDKDYKYTKANPDITVHPASLEIYGRLSARFHSLLIELDAIATQHANARGLHAARFYRRWLNLINVALNKCICRVFEEAVCPHSNPVNDPLSTVSHRHLTAPSHNRDHNREPTDVPPPDIHLASPRHVPTRLRQPVASPSSPPPVPPPGPQPPEYLDGETSREPSTAPTSPRAGTVTPPAAAGVIPCFAIHSDDAASNAASAASDISDITQPGMPGDHDRTPLHTNPFAFGSPFAHQPFPPTMPDALAVTVTEGTALAPAAAAVVTSTPLHPILTSSQHYYIAPAFLYPSTAQMQLNPRAEPFIPAFIRPTSGTHIAQLGAVYQSQSYSPADSTFVQAVGRSYTPSASPTSFQRSVMPPLTPSAFAPWHPRSNTPSAPAAPSSCSPWSELHSQQHECE
jgi:hypothetical protein